jgi:hypothetical protein
MALEIGNYNNRELDIKNWFSDIWYFKFLMWIEKKFIEITVFQNNY